MTIPEIMNNKSLKRLEKRAFLAEAIINRECNFSIILEVFLPLLFLKDLIT